MEWQEDGSMKQTTNRTLAHSLPLHRCPTSPASPKPAGESREEGYSVYKSHCHLGHGGKATQETRVRERTGKGLGDVLEQEQGES